MPDVDVRRADGTVGRSITLDGAIFGVQPNVPLMHQVVTAQLAAARSGTHNTRTRAEVSGGGAKPWRQKGTGRARQGTTRAPHWQGGGVALGPKPRNYSQKTPKKMVRGALHSALSDRAASGKVVVIETWPFTTPSTKEAAALLSTLALEGRVLIVVAPDDELTIKCFRNLPDAQLMLTTELNTYDVLCCDWIVFSEATLPGAVVDQAPVAIESTPRAVAAAAVTEPAAVAEPAADAGPDAAEGADE
jgi:large subunit ribosomal protein L4